MPRAGAKPADVPQKGHKQQVQAEHPQVFHRQVQKLRVRGVIDAGKLPGEQLQDQTDGRVHEEVHHDPHLHAVDGPLLLARPEVLGTHGGNGVADGNAGHDAQADELAN